MAKTLHRLPHELLNQLGLIEHSGILLPKIRKQTPTTCPACDTWSPPCFVFPKNLFNLLTLTPGEYEVMLGHFCPSRNVLFTDHHEDHISRIPESRTITIEQTTDLRRQLIDWTCPTCEADHTGQIIKTLREMGYQVPDPNPRAYNLRLSLSY